MSEYFKVKVDGHTVNSHTYIWEQAHGPVPDGYVIHHRDGNKRNNRLANLEAITHAEHARHHNDKHPRTKVCEVCGADYTPHATKRKRARTCSWECRNKLISQIRRGVATTVQA